MAESSRRYSLNPQLDIQQILLEAQNRWLRPSEVCEILRNYQRFCLTPDPPYKPPSGSLFLFDRKALRYFRKDGHCWRKKKDGKTVREAHEKLKAGSVDVLHCYYAHGEDNENFQRRSYWMLDEKLEHIVLVHYREVKEGSRSSIPRQLIAESGTQNPTRSAQTSSPPSSVQATSALAAHATYASSPSTADWKGQAPSSEFEDVDSRDDVSASPLAEAVSCPGFRISSLQASDTTDKNSPGCRGTMPQPYPRSLTDCTGMNNGSCDPFYVNQVFSGKYPTDGASQQAGGSDIRRRHFSVESFGGASANHGGSSSAWHEVLSSNRIFSDAYEQKVSLNETSGTEDMTRKLLDAYSLLKDGQDGEFGVFSDGRLQTLMRDNQRLVKEEKIHENVEPVDYFLGDKRTVEDAKHIYQMPYEHHSHMTSSIFENKYESRMTPPTNNQSLIETDDHQTSKNTLEGSSCNDEPGGLKKLDSFGRWMNKEIGRDCDDSLMASDSSNYWNALDNQTGDKEVSSLSRHMQLDVDSLGPSLSQDQRFSILDFSPDWAYSEVETKVLISGTFLGGIQHPPNTKWCCMFGEIEVSAEVLSINVLRCQAPAHSPGRIPFYITCCDRLACSEVREFEYRPNPSGVPFPISMKDEPADEIILQIRLAKMLSYGEERRQFNCFVDKCEKCSLKNEISSLISDDENEWRDIEKASKDNLAGLHGNPRELLMQKLIKDRLYEWLLRKAHEDGKGPNILGDEGLGVIHLTAALGYEWAMSPIVAAGVSPSFRDAHGRTGLHWAAYFGREETVVALVRLGAAAGALEDPTKKFPGGRTAADLASTTGHKGIAGYLAEADLTSHLSSLTLKESVLDSVSATLAAEKAIETVKEQSIVPLDGNGEDRLSLKESLAAVRNSAQAAARIQAAFRIHSFRQRKLAENQDEDSEISNEVLALVSVNNKGQKCGHFSDALHAAAVRIQQKYRGWRGRKEFLKIRNRIVKIQAHVRGHQVRKQYKKVVWSVSIVEKAILRWRRKGAGLRGFRADRTTGKVETESIKTDEYDFLRLGRKQKVAGLEKALARVQSMVRYPEARDQYVRLVTNFQRTKIGNEGATSSQLQRSEESKVDDDLLMPMTD